MSMMKSLTAFLDADDSTLGWIGRCLLCGCFLSAGLDGWPVKTCYSQEASLGGKDIDSDGDTASESTQDVTRSEKEIAALINQLGSNQFNQREMASRELQKSGKGALPALREAAKSKDREVRLRAEQLIKAIEEKIRKTVVLKFLRETDPQLDYGMTGWKFASTILGTSRKARELFLEMYQAEPDVVATFEQAPDEVVVKVNQFAGKVSANVMQGADVAIGDAAILLLAMYLPKVQESAAMHDAVKTATFSGLFKRSIMLDPGNTPARKIFGHWLTIVNEANASRALLTARETRIPESVQLARRMLREDLDGGDASVAVSLIMMFGAQQDVELLETLLRDETEIDRLELPVGYQRNAGKDPNGLEPLRADFDSPLRPFKPIPNPQREDQDKQEDMPKIDVFIAQKRDLVLAALLHLAGQDLKKHFPLMSIRHPSGISTGDVAFPESRPEVRQAALQAWEKARPGYLEGKK